MIRVTVLRAVLAGFGVFVLAQIYMVLYWSEIIHLGLLRPMQFGIPVFAASITAYLSPRWKLLTGTSLAFYGAVIGTLSPIVCEYFGVHVDLIGGPLMTFVIHLVYLAPLSVMGSVIGIVLSRKFGNRGQPPSAASL